MFRFQISIAFVALTLNPMSAESKGMPDDIRNYINNQMIGNWEFTTSFDGKTWTEQHTVRWSPSKNAAIGEGTAVDENGSYTITEMTGWNETSKAVVTHAFSSRGDYWTIRYDKRDGNTWTGHGKGMWGGKVWESSVKQVWSADGFRYEDTTEGKPFIVVGKRQTLGNAERQLQMFGRFMAGTWTRTDDGFERKHTYRWGLKRKFMRSNGRKDPQPWDGFIGIDLSNGQVAWWGFFADGTSGVLHLTKATDNEWEFRGYDSSPDGAFHRRVLIKKLGANQLHGKVEDTAGGTTEVIFDETWDRTP